MFAGSARLSDGRQPSSTRASAGPRVAASSPSAAIGAWAAKIARQSNTWVRMPPSAGPSAKPNVPASVQTAIPEAADPRSRASTGSAPASSSAAPTPWTVLAAIRNPRLPLSEQAIEAATKTSRPVTRTLVALKR